jgi:cysteine desulfurase
MAVYLDCAATTPIDPRVLEEVIRYLGTEFGNAGSRAHDYGTRARRAVELARDQVAGAVGARRSEVVFTSGATESNNLAILGLAEHGTATGRMHLVSTAIEHHAVLEPLQALARQGFEISLVPPTPGGWVEPEAILGAVREDTLLVSVMQANNETGIRQPIDQIAAGLEASPAFFHVDAAQGYAHDPEPLRLPRVDLISLSGHKFHAPKGIGALVARRRDGSRPPLTPLMYGGGQEQGVRPGTLPAALIVGLGMAAELANGERQERREACLGFKARLMAGLAPLRPHLIGDPERSAPHIVGVAFPGLDAEEVIEALRDLVAVSQGAACTSQSTSCSHVLGAMGVDLDLAASVIRFSWCHLTPDPDWARVVAAIEWVRSEVGGGKERRGTPRE